MIANKRTQKLISKHKPTKDFKNLKTKKYETSIIVFKVDQMECVNCENKVKKNIPFEKGVKKMETDLKTRTVTITYDSDKTNIQKLKDGFAKFKYEAKVISDVEVK